MFKYFYSLLFLLLLSGCATQKQPMNSQDPYESYNRAMFDFNMAFNDAIGESVGNAYKNYVPKPAQTGISNFVINLKMPLNMVNNFFQGNVERGLGDFMRFTINTVFGLGGFIDIATPAGLPYEKEDLGQTLYKWGVWTESSFIVMPFFGAYTTRELVGVVGDASYNPTYSYIIQTDLEGRTAIFVVDSFNSYVSVLDYVDQLKEMHDPYIFYRESYLQYRTNLIYNGNPPNNALDDFDFN